MINKNAAVNRVRIYMAFWIFLIVVFSAVIYIQVRKEAGFSAQISTLTQQLKDADEQQQNLQLAVDSKTSNKSVEDFAHNQLGLVYPNEIVIYIDNYK